MSSEPAADSSLRTCSFPQWASLGHLMMVSLTTIKTPFDAFFDPENWLPVTSLTIPELWLHWRLCGAGRMGKKARLPTLLKQTD